MEHILKYLFLFGALIFLSFASAEERRGDKQSAIISMLWAIYCVLSIVAMSYF